MRKMNSDGLALCKMQGTVFELSSVGASSSSEIFIRRFMHSQVANEMDNLAFLDGTMSEADALQAVEDEYGRSEYGKTKYPSEVLFWIGYLYRYWSFTEEISSRQAYAMVKPKELKSLYQAYHSLDCEQAIERILEAHVMKRNESPNERLLSLIRTRAYEEGMEIVSEPEVKYVTYNGETIGEIGESSEHGAILRNCRFRNKEMEAVATRKAREFAK